MISYVRAAITLAALGLLAACQSPGGSVGVDEAKRLASGFSDDAALRTPRRATDIIQLIQNHPGPTAADLAKRRAAADRKPPKHANDAQRAAFYFERAQAADNIGRDLQSFRDLRRAREHTDKTGDEMLSRQIYRYLMRSEIAVGNYRQGLETMHQLISQGSRSEMNSAHLAVYYGILGDLQQSKKWHGTANSLYFSRDGASPVVLPRADYGLALAQGDWPAAEKALREVIETYLQHHRGLYVWFLPSQRALLAEALLNQGRPAATEVVAREGLRDVLDNLGKANKHAVGVITMLARIRMARGFLDEAQELAELAIGILQDVGVSQESKVLADARFVIARVHLLQGNSRAAVKQFDTVRRDLRNSKVLFDRFYADDPALALALIDVKRGGEALKTLCRTHDKFVANFGRQHAQTREVRAAMGLALVKTGKRAQGLEILAETLPELMDQLGDKAGSADNQRMRSWRLRTILERSIEVLHRNSRGKQRLPNGGDPAELAFQVAVALSERRVHQTLAQSAARSSLGDPELAELAHREQDASSRIESLERILSENLLAEDAGASVSTLKQRIAQLRSARATLFKQIETRFPDYGRLIKPQVPSSEQVRGLLRADEAMVVVYTGNSGTYLWGVAPGKPRQFLRSALTHSKIENMVDVLRESLEPYTETIGEIPAFDVGTGYTLYRSLLHPLRKTWQSQKTINVVTNGALSSLPLALLPTSKRGASKKQKTLFSGYRRVTWLARTHAVTVQPSVSALLSLRAGGARQHAERPFVGFGDPFFSQRQAQRAQVATVAESDEIQGRGIGKLRARLRSAPRVRAADSASLADLPRLADTATELKSIAETLGADPASDLHLGANATEAAVKKADLAQYRVISFATHGLIPGDLDGLDQPALALTTPKVAGGREDGLLTASEILGLRLNADWAVLLACNTASGEGEGAEAISGLGRAFFYAGTRALLVSNWPVHSAATTELMTVLFRVQVDNPGLSRAQALRRAMLFLIDKAGFKHGGRTAFSYAHPIFWAPFTLVGDGGAATPGS